MAPIERSSDDLILPVDKGPGKGEGGINVTELCRRCSRAEAENRVLREMLDARGVTPAAVNGALAADGAGHA